MKKYISAAAVLAVFTIGALAVSAQAPTQSMLSGWAWSSNIGWISFNSTDNNAGGSLYNVFIDNSTGNFGGYAWSPNIGWVNFGANSCGNQGNVNMTTGGTVTGWAQAVAGGSGGWDGCIKLSGTSPDYGLSLNAGTGVFSGYGWGSTNVGWVQFNPSTAGSGVVLCTGNNCTNNNGPSFSFQVNDSILGWGSAASIPVTSGTAVVAIRWNSSNVISCQSDYTNGNWSDTNLSQSAADALLAQNCGNGNTATQSITFSNVVVGTPKTLTIKYKDLTHSFWLYSTINLNFTQGTNPPNTCMPPARSTLCPGSLDTSVPSGTQTKVYDNGQCPQPLTYCQYQCQVGYTLKNNTTCVKSSTQEI